MAANADNNLGAIKPFENKDGTADIWDGSKGYGYARFRRRHLASGGKVSVAGFTHSVACLGNDRGNVNGVPWVGNMGDAVRVRDEADGALRGQSSAMRLCANIAEGCAPRRVIEETPELAASGYFALLYLDSECLLAEPRTELDDKWRTFISYEMEEEFDIRKFTAETMMDWIKFYKGKWQTDLTDQQRLDKGVNELCIRIVHGCTSKFPDKRELTDEPCVVPGCVWPASHVAVVFAAGPPVVFPRPAVTRGHFRLDQVCDYMDRRWRAAIKAGQIHVIETPEEKVRYIKKNGKQSWKKKFDRSSHKPNSSSSSSSSESRPKIDLRCYNCGGIGHIAGKCGTEKGSLTRSLLMKIGYPSETNGKWPDSWSGQSVRMVSDDCDCDEQGSDDGARDDGEDESPPIAEESDESADDTSDKPSVRYVREGDAVRYIVDGSTQNTFSKVKAKVLRIVSSK